MQKLYPLSLDRTPAAEILPGTAMAWLEAITTGRQWDRDRDADRIRAAFITLSQTREAWPQPKHFLDALPRVEQAAIGYEVKPLSKAEADARLAEIRRMLNAPMPALVPEQQRECERPPLSEVERDLQQHYADRKSAAAGDAP